MNLKENLASLKNELAELKERIEADDAEAIARGVELKAEIEAKEKEVEAAEQKAALLNSIGEKQEDDFFAKFAHDNGVAPKQKVYLDILKQVKEALKA